MQEELGKRKPQGKSQSSPFPALTSNSWIQRELSGAQAAEVGDRPCSLRGKPALSRLTHSGQDQPRESGAFSKTIIGDLAPEPDSGSIS